ncbi:MAG TPA: phage tail protein [Kofleriaceae bacterium]|nr:phage tail protein [Kofleriaceae bacterium]
MPPNQSAQRQDPVLTSFFKVSIAIPNLPASAAALFRSVSGLKIESDVVDYREGGLNGASRKLVGGVKWPNLVFKRGLTRDTAFIQWRLSWLDDNSGRKLKRVSGSIVQLDHDLTTAIHTWAFAGAWPVLWEGPEYDASKGELAMETLEIAHEGLTLKA